MSAEAVRTFQRTSTARGMRRFVLLAIAHHSKHRVAPFWAKVSHPQIAAFCGIDARSAKRLVYGAVADGDLDIVEPGGGQTPNLYALRLERGDTLSTPDVTERHDSPRERRYHHNPARRILDETEVTNAIDDEYAHGSTIDIDVGHSEGFTADQQADCRCHVQT